MLGLVVSAYAVFGDMMVVRGVCCIELYVCVVWWFALYSGVL